MEPNLLTMARKTYDEFIGKRFGNWLVTGIDPTREIYMDRKGRRVYFAKAFVTCTCSARALVRIADLKRGRSSMCRSCMGKKAEARLPHYVGRENGRWKGFGEIPGRMIGQIKSNARVRKLNFDLSPEYLHSLWIAQGRRCAITGEIMIMPPSNKSGTEDEKQRFASLDRIDSGLGYVEGNVQWVCKTVNLMKQNLQTVNFLQWVKAIHDFNKDT